MGEQTDGMFVSYGFGDAVGRDEACLYHVPSGGWTLYCSTDDRK